MLQNCKRTLRSIACSLPAALLVACAAPAVKQNVTMPANAGGMTEVKKVAVVTFNGDKNQEFSTKLESFFANVKVGGKPYFTVVDRATLDVILKEQRMVSESERFNEKDAVKLGDLSGADTIMSGVVSWPKIEASDYKDKRSVCVAETAKGKCTKYGETTVDCVKQRGSFEFTVKAISVRKGEVTFTKNYTSQADNSYCTDSKEKQKLPTELADTAMKLAMETMRRDVAPYDVVVSISLMESDDSKIGDNKEAKSQLDSGLAFAKEGRMDRACEKFRLGTVAYDQSPALYHNLGVCAEIESNMDKALSIYKQADNLLAKPDKLISSAIARVEERMKKDREVASQMR